MVFSHFYVLCSKQLLPYFFQLMQNNVNNSVFKPSANSPIPFTNNFFCPRVSSSTASPNRDNALLV